MDINEYSVVSRKVCDMASPTFCGYLDPYGILAMTEQKRRALIKNPFVTDQNSHCQIVGEKNNVVFGGEINFPLAWKIRGEVYQVIAGSTTYVAKEYRKTELGLQFRDYRRKFAQNDISEGVGSSQMMVKVLKFLKNDLFFIPRRVALFKSRAVIESRIKNKFASKIISIFLDGILALYWCIMFVLQKIETFGFVYEKISADNDQAISAVSKLISEDEHPFMELHDEKWIKWHMTESFSNDGPLELTLVKKKNKVVAFYMIKRRFHKQASTRGFEDVWLGSIMEWQVINKEMTKLPWFLIHAALACRKDMDAIEFVSSDKELSNFFSNIGWRHVGDSNFNFKIWDGPLKNNSEIKNIDNWRIRPAMGDAGLS